MYKFNSSQFEFFKKISETEHESDWLKIPGYLLISEKRMGSKLVGLAGVTLRYWFIPSLFLAVSKENRNLGVASILLADVVAKWKKPIFLTFYSDKSFLLSFYTKFGFKKIIPWFGKKILCIKF